MEQAEDCWYWSQQEGPCPTRECSRIYSMPIVELLDGQTRRLGREYSGSFTMDKFNAGNYVRKREFETGPLERFSPGN